MLLRNLSLGKVFSVLGAIQRLADLIQTSLADGKITSDEVGAIAGQGVLPILALFGVQTAPAASDPIFREVQDAVIRELSVERELVSQEAAAHGD